MRGQILAQRFVMEDSFGRARPGRGHLALASLYRAGKVPAIGDAKYRQPPSDFRLRAGRCGRIAWQHDLRRLSRMRSRYELSWVRQKFEAAGDHAPDCACGGYIKTATVSFGQAMPAEAMQRAEQLTRGCDLFFAIGSSLVVWPAAGFPLLAKRNGAALVIINREPTEFDELADLVVHHDIGDVLDPFIAH